VVQIHVIEGIRVYVTRAVVTGCLAEPAVVRVGYLRLSHVKRHVDFGVAGGDCGKLLNHEIRRSIGPQAVPESITGSIVIFPALHSTEPGRKSEDGVIPDKYN
jgi:hypothetical protein